MELAVRSTAGCHRGTLAPPSRHAQGPALRVAGRAGARVAVRLRSVPPSNEFNDAGGDKDLQESLLAQLRLQVEGQTAKDEIVEQFEGKKEGIKQLAEEVGAGAVAGRGRWGESAR